MTSVATCGIDTHVGYHVDWRHKTSLVAIGMQNRLSMICFGSGNSQVLSKWFSKKELTLACLVGDGTKITDA